MIPQMRDQLEARLEEGHVASLVVQTWASEVNSDDAGGEECRGSRIVRDVHVSWLDRAEQVDLCAGASVSIDAEGPTAPADGFLDAVVDTGANRTFVSRSPSSAIWPSPKTAASLPPCWRTRWTTSTSATATPSTSTTRPTTIWSPSLSLRPANSKHPSASEPIQAGLSIT